jgi:integrase
MIRCALVRVIKMRAEQDDIIAKRDLALPLWYLMTGMRRSEVISVRGKDIDLKDGRIIVRGKVKGGTYVGREITDPDLRTAVVDYLTASRRLHALIGEAPL